MTVVFDQAYSRVTSDGGASERDSKLRALRDVGVHAFMYESTARFVIAARDSRVRDAARERLLRYLPRTRLVE